MSNKQMWSLVVEGATPDDGYFSLATFPSKERAEMERDKLENKMEEIEKNADKDAWGGWDVFPSRYRVEPMPAVVEDDEEFNTVGYFVVFPTAELNEDKTRATREIEHAQFILSTDQMLDLTEDEKKAIRELREGGKKYVQYRKPQHFDGEDVVYETLCTFNVADIPLEVDVAELGL